MGTAGSPKQLPVIKVPNVSFEFIKGYTDGRLTLDVGPVSCSLGEAQQVSVAHLKEKKAKIDLRVQTCLSVCGLLIMGHGHYSDFGSVLLEYAWLVDVQCRSVAAEMSSVQVFSISFFSPPSFQVFSLAADVSRVDRCVRLSHCRRRERVAARRKRKGSHQDPFQSRPLEIEQTSTRQRARAVARSVEVRVRKSRT